MTAFWIALGFALPVLIYLAWALVTVDRAVGRMGSMPLNETIRGPRA